MKKKIKGILVIALVFGLMLNANSALADTGYTEGGSSGQTTVTYTITIVGSINTYDQPYLSISTKDEVEGLGIRNINVVLKNGSSDNGVSVSANNSKGPVTYRGSTYSPDYIKTLSATFYVNSKSYGNFTKNVSISS